MNRSNPPPAISLSFPARSQIQSNPIASEPRRRRRREQISARLLSKLSMAPPKPATPDAPKQKVTAAQVAFLVERYLADNGFHAALAAFRSDAAHLFSPRRAKPPPKGLIPLADILHDYIALKEGRVAVDSAMHAMHSLVSTYYAASSSLPPPMMVMMPPLPPAANTAQPSSPPLVPPLFVASSSSPPQAQGAAGYASPVVHHYAHASTALLVHNSSDMQSQPTKKRKHSKSAGKTTTTSKKSCTATTSDTKGKAAASQPSNDNLSAAHPTSAEHSAMAKLPVHNSSVAKSLFKQPQPQPHHSSPCTPQQSHAIQDQDQPAAYPTQRPLPVPANSHTQQDIASSQCSIVASKTLIVSPLKGGAYYAVERSYHVSSPLKSTTHKSTKREHVKGKLNFDATDSRPAPNEQQTCDKASTSSDEDKQQDDFDIDFTNLFDGEFSFSEFLLDLDLDTEGLHCQDPSTSAEVQRLEPVANSGYVTADPGLPDSMKLVAADSNEDFDSRGATSVTSVRAITKRIKIVSPVKGRTTS